MTKLDATKMEDWEIAEAAEENMKPFATLASELGLREDLIINPENGLTFNYDVIIKFIDNIRPPISLKHLA